jgi:hypothetical protein
LTFSCQTGLEKSPKSPQELFATIIKDSLKIDGKEQFSRIFILTEKGCINCNRSFSKVIEEEINDSTLCIISASGIMVDISSFQNGMQKNVIFDYDNFFINNDLINTSSIGYLVRGELDTIIELSAAELQNQFRLIKSNPFNLSETKK